MPPIEKRKRAIADTEWTITIQVTAKDVKLPLFHEMRFADSVLAKDPEQVGWCIASRMQELAKSTKPTRARKRK